MTFTAGAGTASITLYDAQSTTLTATQGSITGTSGSFMVSGTGTQAGIGLASITTSPSPAPTCTGAVGNLTCTSSGEGNSAQSLVAKIQLQDLYGNA